MAMREYGQPRAEASLKNGGHDPANAMERTRAKIAFSPKLCGEHCGAGLNSSMASGPEEDGTAASGRFRQKVDPSQTLFRSSEAEIHSA
jgi:hypothetical protein